MKSQIIFTIPSQMHMWFKSWECNNNASVVLLLQVLHECCSHDYAWYSSIFVHLYFFSKDPFEQEGQWEFLHLVQVISVIPCVILLFVQLLITSILRLENIALQQYGKVNTSNMVPNIGMIQRIDGQMSRTRKAWLTECTGSCRLRENS